jgi:hypothetical protein
LKVLLDNCVPRPFSRHIVGHVVEHAGKKGWGELANGVLLATAHAAGFVVMITTDRSIEHQQGSLPMPVLIIDSLFNEVSELIRYLPSVHALLKQPLQPRIYLVARLPPP